MKKIILITLLSFFSFLGYSQQLTTYTESFDSGIPSTWAVFDNGVGANTWQITSNATEVYSAPNSAEIRRENIGLGNTSEDWMVTDSQVITTNKQFRFYATRALAGDLGTQYQIRISATSQSNQSTFTTIKSYNSIELSKDPLKYEEKVIDIPAEYENKTIFIAFVRVFTQVTAGTSGDKWLLDNVRIVDECVSPSNLSATNINANSALATWDGNAQSTYDLEYGPKGFIKGTGETKKGITSSTNSFSSSLTGLEAETDYDYYVTPICGDVVGDFTGPYFFTTRNYGSVCATPITIPSLPYEVKLDETGKYGNDINIFQGTGCNAVPESVNYLSGNDVFYSYTSGFTGSIGIIMTPIGITSTNSSIFVYDTCNKVGVECVAGAANGGLNAREISFDATAGITYIIVVSSDIKTPSVKYSLLIQQQLCLPTPTGGTVSNTTLTTADLSWTDTTFSSWQVAIQPLGDGVPQESDSNIKNTASNPYTATDLTSGTLYQFWVRSECSIGSKTYTAWAGPFPFNTAVCNPSETCNYTFSMTDSANNGWNGAQMQVRQNGIVLQTIGSTYTSGAGPVNITVPLCNQLPFDLFWSVPGTQPKQCIVSIINKFGQTIYTMPSGTDLSGTVVYSGTVNCDVPQCDIAPTNVTATAIYTKTADISWVAPATDLWDIYVAPEGTPDPTLTTPPTYTGVRDQPYTISNLSPDQVYCVYVRVQCSPNPSPWSAKYCFRTLPSCPRPSDLTVTAITTTSAVLDWTNGSVSDTNWDILFVAAKDYTQPPTPANEPILGPNDIYNQNISNKPYTETKLKVATIYYYYVRTICPGGEKSIWSDPKVFNTLTCNTEEKCDYKFILKDAGKNGWQGARMQVRQNGIVVRTIGSTITGSGPTQVTVAICDDLIFDLYWSIAGTAPEEVEISIVDKFGDVIYTKVAGEGSPNEVLFTSIGECTAPTCPKPTQLTADQATVTQTSAILGWTETGTASKWQLYVVPKGSVAPDNKLPYDPNATAPYYTANTNPYVIEGLTPGTTYEFYVRAICATDDVGKWTILTPKSFATKAPNDECVIAIPIPVNPTRTCTQKVSGSLLGATATDPVVNCAGLSDDDVWFSFVAENSDQLIGISNLNDNTVDLNHTLYTGDCSNLTLLYCSDSNNSVATGLVKGQTYYIRVYTVLKSTVFDKYTFDICVTQPEPILNDNCSTAATVIPNKNLKCEGGTVGYVLGATASPEQNTCIGDANDDVWFTFVANANDQYIELIPTLSSTSYDLNHAVYSGDCNNLILEYCSTINSLTSSSENFLKGKTYYIRVWSNSSLPQDIVFGVCVGTTYPPITTSVSTYTTEELVREVLLKTKCVEVTNITSSTGSDFNSVTGIGSFDGSQSDFPYKDGVILSSGSVLAAPGPNISLQQAGTIEWGGDDDLDQIIISATGIDPQSKNASVLEFDFVPLINKMSFNFLMASEEYGNYQCGYADSFAFLLTDLTLGTPAVNLAIVPNTKSPISVITVRDNAYNVECLSENKEYFGEYYGFYNGVNYDATREAPINFNGATVSLVAQSPVVPGHKYHIKMVIADSRDTAWDSAVFIEGKSFDIGGVDLGEDITGANSTCFGEPVTLDSGLDTSFYSIKWFKDDVEIPNENSSIYVATSPGVYRVDASLTGTTCIESDTIIIESFPEIVPGTPNNLAVCNGTGVGTFDLTQNTPVLLAPLSINGEYNVVYFTSEVDANNNINQISNPTAYTNTSNPQTIYARVNNLLTQCYTTSTFTISAQNNPPQYTLSGSTSICPEGTTTITVVPTSGSFDPNQVTYTWTFQGSSLSNTGSSLTINGSQGYGDYTVTVYDNGCESTQSFTISNSNTVWNFTITASPESLCANQEGLLTANVTNNTSGAPVTYTYTLPDGSTQVSSSNTLAINAIGTYTVGVNIQGCENSNSITVNENTSAFDISFEQGCNANSYQLTALIDDSLNPENATYTWSGPSFEETENGNTIVLKAAGSYSVSITTADGCTSSDSVMVNSIACLIQQGISPNNDGKNDNFDLEALNVKHLSIYNRYGSKVYDMANYTNQWYGTTNDGKELPDGTYYYVIERDGMESVTGWIYVIHEHK